MTPLDVPALEVRNLVKSYGSVRAIDDVSLAVRAGVFVTLLGPSGCGKSTLLRTIAGFISPDSGTIRIGERDATSLPPSSRPVNMVFQDYALFPHLTVRGNVGFGCEMKGLSSAEVRSRADAVLDLVRLRDLADRYPDELSGGQRQRVALARALAPDPISLLLDEPLGALDLQLRQEMQRELKALQRKTGKTFVFVTHDQEEAMSMSDLIAVMRNGRIEQIDRPEAIYSRPVNRYVGSFIGAANLLDAVVERVDGEKLRIVVNKMPLVVPLTAVTRPGVVAVGERLTLLVRPEDVLPGPSVEGSLPVSGRITERTFFGNRTHLRFLTDDGLALLADARPDASAVEGDVFTAHVQPRSIVLLRGDQP